MNADRKKRIAHEISNWKNACNCRAVQLTGDRMAALLQELIDKPEEIAPAELIGLPPVGELQIDAEPAPSLPVAHPDDIAVDRFAAAMKTKMDKSRAVGRYGWDDPAVCSAEDLRLFLVNHIAKGDPVDVGNFAMMLFNRGETTATKHRPEPTADVVRDAERYRWLLKQEWSQQAADRFDLPDGGLQNRFEKCMDEFIDAAMSEKGQL